MLVEPKPDMKDYMYLYRLVVFVISISIFPCYACIHLIVCVSLLFLFHFFFGHTCIKLLDVLILITPYALHATPHNYQVLHREKMYVKGIQGHAFDKI